MAEKKGRPDYAESIVGDKDSASIYQADADGIALAAAITARSLPARSAIE